MGYYTSKELRKLLVRNPPVIIQAHPSDTKHTIKFEDVNKRKTEWEAFHAFCVSQAWVTKDCSEIPSWFNCNLVDLLNLTEEEDARAIKELDIE